MRSEIPADVKAIAEAVESQWSNDGSSISTRTLLVDGIANAILAERRWCASIAASWSRRPPAGNSLVAIAAATNRAVVAARIYDTIIAGQP